MQVPKKLKAIIIIVIFTAIIILPVCLALIREYGYKDNQAPKGIPNPSTGEIK